MRGMSEVAVAIVQLARISHVDDLGIVEVDSNFGIASMMSSWSVRSWAQAIQGVTQRV
jgi:hypothetical protein